MPPGVLRSTGSRLDANGIVLRLQTTDRSCCLLDDCCRSSPSRSPRWPMCRPLPTPPPFRLRAGRRRRHPRGLCRQGGLSARAMAGRVRPVRVSRRRRLFPRPGYRFGPWPLCHRRRQDLRHACRLRTAELLPRRAERPGRLFLPSGRPGERREPPPAGSRDTVPTAGAALRPKLPLGHFRRSACRWPSLDIAGASPDKPLKNEG